MVADISGTEFAWREAGRASLPPMVLLHGLGGSRMSWEPQLAGLAARFRVAAWDLPGYGDSPALTGPTTFVTLADAVRRFLDELGVERCHLVGISFGGMIAQYAAAAYPDRISTLALMATSPKFGLDGTRPDAWRAARLAPLDAGLAPADFSAHVLRAIAGPHITKAAFAGQQLAMARISADGLRRCVDCLVTHDSTSVLAAIRAPTLCIVGELDQETPVAYSQALVNAIPHAVLAVVPDAGHLVNVEASRAVNALLTKHASTQDFEVQHD